MKYQIYLNKETSELVNGIAKGLGKKASTFIKDFLEQCFNASEITLGDDAVEVIKKYGRD